METNEKVPPILNEELWGEQPTPAELQASRENLAEQFAGWFYLGFITKRMEHESASADLLEDERNRENGVAEFKHALLADNGQAVDNLLSSVLALVGGDSLL